MEGKPGGKRPLVRTRRRSVDNIKVGLTGRVVKVLTQVTQDGNINRASVNTILTLPLPRKAGSSF